MSRAHQARNKARRTERNLLEQAAEQARSARRESVMRMRRGAVAAAAVAVSGVLIAAGVSSRPHPSGQVSSASMEREVSALLSGIPQSGDTLGQPSAPITLEVFGDLESADVRTFMLWLLPGIIRDWVRPNVVKIQYRSFMTASSPYPNVFVSQRVAALAAGTQDRLWNFVETFYHEQHQEHTRYATDAYLSDLGRQIPGLNLSEWENDRDDRQLAAQVIEDNRTARSIKFPDAPVFLLGRSGGEMAPWRRYRLYEEPGLKPGFIKRPVHSVSFLTTKTLGRAIERLP